MGFLVDDERLLADTGRERIILLFETDVGRLCVRGFFSNIGAGLEGRLGR